MSKNDPYQNNNGQFHEPSFSQMADMTTKALIIAKISGNAPGMTWGQVFMPAIASALFTGAILFIICVIIFGAKATSH